MSTKNIENLWKHFIRINAISLLESLYNFGDYHTAYHVLSSVDDYLEEDDLSKWDGLLYKMKGGN